MQNMRNMKIKILSILFFTGLSLLLQASPQEDFEKANKAYMAGFYENAASLYEKILESGMDAPDLYYNLGNAYFKMNDIPSAILNYERALKYDPGNEDYQYNLRVANSKIVDKIDVLPELFYKRWWNNLKIVLSPDGWALMALFSFVFIFISIAVFFLARSIQTRKFIFAAGLVLLFIHVISGIIALQTFREAKNQKTAIIFTPTLPVKSSPDESSIDLFVIHEGLKVTILDRIGEWHEIRIANGSKGWVEASHLKPV